MAGGDGGASRSSDADGGCRLLRLVERRGYRDQESRSAVAELVGELGDGVERIDGRVDSPQRRDGVEDDRILRKVRAVDGEDIALPKAATGEAGGDTTDRVGELAICQRPAADAVDHGWLVPQPLGMPQHVLGDRGFGNGDVRPRAADDHQPRLREAVGARRIAAGGGSEGFSVAKCLAAASAFSVALRRIRSKRRRTSLTSLGVNLDLSRRLITAGPPLLS